MGHDRRSFLGVCGATLLGTAGGCLRLTQQTESADETAGGDETRAETQTETQSATVSRAERVLGENTYEWLSTGTEFDGVTDRTGSDTATVSVGDDRLAESIDPAILKISPGTTVVWEWTGEGGGHGITSMDGSFGSGSVVLGDEFTFEHTFSESGVYRYYCKPHEAIGGKGVIAVEE